MAGQFEFALEQFVPRSVKRLLGNDEEAIMRKLAVLAAAGMVIAASAYAYAAPKGTAATGASEFSPGDRMLDLGGSRRRSHGASEFSPSDRMRDLGGPRQGMRGASEFSPGDLMNDKRHRHGASARAAASTGFASSGIAGSGGLGAGGHGGRDSDRGARDSGGGRDSGSGHDGGGHGK
jgi:hypothetical protein